MRKAFGVIVLIGVAIGLITWWISRPPLEGVILSDVELYVTRYPENYTITVYEVRISRGLYTDEISWRLVDADDGITISQMETDMEGGDITVDLYSSTDPKLLFYRFNDNDGDGILSVGDTFTLVRHTEDGIDSMGTQPRRFDLSIRDGERIGFAFLPRIP